MTIKNFIWDFDGTLYDTYPYTVKAFLRALTEDGYSIDGDEAFQLMMNSLTYAKKYYGEKLNISDSTWEKFKRYSDEENIITSPPFPYAIELLRFVKENGGTNYMDTHRDRKVYEFLSDVGCLDLFKELVLIDNGFKCKPDPEAVSYLVDKYSLNCDETVMVGDRECDIMAGKSAGVRTCYITNRNGIVVAADYVFDSIGEMFQSLLKVM